jgi:transcriptional regulator with XRE-family HTH domain
MSLITGHVFRKSLDHRSGEWHRVATMIEIRELRRAAGLTQRELAVLLAVPVESLRAWDSGRRIVPAVLLRRARATVAHHQRQHELLPLAALAMELGVHVRTLQAAARTGRLETHFSVRSVFGRPIRAASRAAGAQFLARH